MSLVEINRHPSPRQLRTFGLAGATLLVLVAAMLGWRQSLAGIAFSPAGAASGAAIFTAAGAVVGTIALWRPVWLRGVYVVSCLLAWPIGTVISWVVLGLVFYGLILPLGLLRRAGGRGMRPSPDPTAPSYWIKRPPASPPARYLRPW